jgi:archaeal flagellin FlaB
MGKKLKEIIKNKDIGAMGIGAMIIFIAMVLVAGIAASVLIQTSTTLETQVLKTGSETTYAVASGVLLEGIEAYNSSGALTMLAFEIRPRAGSPDIDLDTTVIEISDGDNKYVLRYGGTLTLSNDTDSDIFDCSFPDGTATTQFFIIVLQDADESCTQDTPVINFGDHVVLAVGNVFGGLSPRTSVFGRVIPEEGSPAIIDFRTPESFTDDVMDLL